MSGESKRSDDALIKRFQKALALLKSKNDDAYKLASQEFDKIQNIYKSHY